MKKLVQAASFLAASVALASFTLSSESGFATGVSHDGTTLSQGDILIDPAMVDADEMDDGADVSAAEDEKEQLLLDEAQLAAIAEAEKPEEVAEEPAPVISASSLAELVDLHRADEPLDREMHCLAGAVYFESKGESLAGQLAVARVVLARAESGRFPSSICGVVYQRRQFSFVRGGRMPAIAKRSEAWQRAKAIARIATEELWDSPVEGALFFHAKYVSPNWRLTRLGAVDQHIFYR